MKLILIFILFFALNSNAQKILIVFDNLLPTEISLVDSNDIKIGYSNYYDKGILILSMMYKNGKPNGQWSKYDTVGRLRESFNYLNGKLIGEHRWYNESGDIIKISIHNKPCEISQTIQFF